AKHIMEDIDPDFPRKISPGESILVAGENFGMGSSREQAPLVIKESGIIAVVAKSFARIFFRNSFNIGLLLLETDTDKINNFDRIEVNLDRGIITETSRGIELKVKPVPKFMQDILSAGGIVKFILTHKGLDLK
ncbi:MAG: 3-isopropylmalate dehydratase, partial [Candidatus Omnitrophica bacterium]|nr:3-isopropylmalate dehydratase [Candidatus Omnitrophota bacterium]